MPCRERQPVDEQMIHRAVDLLRGAAPGVKIILFGSHARGTASDESDLDFLVVKPVVTSRREEIVRLRDVLRPLRVPVDIFVASEKTFREWADTPGTLLYEAATEGRVFDAAA